MNVISNDISCRIRNLSFLCACFIVGVHLPYDYDHATGFYRLVLTVIPYCFNSDLALPFFFAISGYLLVGESERPGWLSFALKKRIRNLLIPYFLFNLVGILLVVCGSLVCGRAYQLIFFFRDVGLLPVSGPIGPNWFIRCLFYFIVLASSVNGIIRKSRSWTVLLLGGIFFAGQGIEFLHLETKSYILWRGFHQAFSLMGFFWFVLGMTLRQYPVRIMCNLVPARWGGGILAVITALTCLVRLLSVEVYPVWWEMIRVPFMVCSLWFVIPSRIWPNILVRNSFAIFLVHPLVIYIVKAGCKAWRMEEVLYNVWGYLLFLGVALFVSIYLVEVFRRKFPGVAHIAFGGR